MKQLSFFLLAFLCTFLFSCETEDAVKELDQKTLTIENLIDRENFVNPTNKTYVLVHGAWHPESVWDWTRRGLEHMGHRVLSLQLKSLGNDPSDPATVSFADHVEQVEQVVKSTPGSVILVGHSYGGMLISQVAEMIPEKIEKLIYVSAYLPQNGETMLGLSSTDQGSVALQNVIIEEGNLIVTIHPDAWVEALYTSTLKSQNPFIKTKVEETIGLLKPHPLLTTLTPVSLTEKFNTIEKVYVSCLQDQAITPVLQKAMYEKANNTEVIELNADHSPMITAPVRFLHILNRYAR